MDRDSLSETMLTILLLKVAGMVAFGEEEKALAAELNAAHGPDEANIFQTAFRLGRSLPPGLWATGAAIFLYRWEEGGKTQAPDLAVDGPYALPYDRPADADTVDALRRATVALAVEEFSRPEEGPHPLVGPLIALARFAEQRDEAELAYDLLNFALPLIDDRDPWLGEVAEPGHRLALAGGKPAQIAIMSVKVAAAAVAVAAAAADDAPGTPLDTYAGLRLKAYNAAEVAIERVAMAPDPFREGIADMLMSVLESHEWLSHLRVRLIPLVANESGREHYRKILESPDWPARVATLSTDESLRYMPAMFHLMRAEIEFENERLRLRRLVAQRQVTTDAVDWSFSLADFSDSVPHSMSFLRDREFANQLVVLTHELSHVLSFLGGIGVALTALRVAALVVSSELWRLPQAIGSAQWWELYKAQRGMAELGPGDATQLFSSDRQLELRRKSQILLDVWTPWLEGIAVYGELGADPTLDALTINPVTECLRNLTDIFYEAKDEKPAREQVLAHFQAFEARCSEALAAVGPQRLQEYLWQDDQPYFHGYLAVRAIAARWRETTGRNLPSGSCFDLMLHATRHGAHHFIPDLSLHSEAFRAAASERMAAFVSGLAALPAADVDLYFDREDSSVPARPVHWNGSRLEPVVAEQLPELTRLEGELIETAISQALRSLSAPEDLERFEPSGSEEAAFLAMGAEVGRNKLAERYGDLDDEVALFHGLYELGSVLPIGRCSSVFFLQRYTDAEHSRLYANLRTTRSHVDTGQPSYNGIWFPMSVEDGERLEEAYGREASPRIAISRVILLAGFEGGGARWRFPHLLALTYPGWFALRGASEWVQSVKDDAPEAWESASGLIERRLQDNEAMALERRFIASGREAIERTLAWLEASPQWAVDDDVWDLRGWVAHQRSLAKAILDPATRAGDRDSAGPALLVAVYGDSPSTAALHRSSFPHLTRHRPADRLAIAKALFETALVAGESEYLDSSEGGPTAGGAPLFHRSRFGWDVAPALIGA